MKDKPTHQVIDKTYLPDEFPECFEGTYQECCDFVADQCKSGGVNTYEIVRITPQ